MMRITLAEQKYEWHPGDIIAGTVSVQPSPQVDVDRVVLVFEGRAKSKLTVRRNNSTSTYRTSLILFQQRVELFRGPFTLAAPQTWPFALQLPEDCRHVQGASWLAQERGARARFNVDPGQPLPPTMSDSEGGMLSSAKDCYVSYRLRAELVRSSSIKQNWESNISLQVAPWRSEQLFVFVPTLTLMPRNVTTRSLNLDPEVGDRDLRFKEKLRASFKSDSVPSVSYVVAAELPDAAIVNRAIPVFLSLSDPRLGEDGDLPPVVLKSFELELVTTTDQITQHGSGFFGTDSRHESWSNRRRLDSWAGSLVLGERRDLSPLYSKRTVWRDGPSFSTFNVARSHRLTLKIVIECARKEHTFMFTTSPNRFKLLPAHCAPAVIAEAAPAYQADPLDSEVAPAYDEAVKAKS